MAMPNCDVCGKSAVGVASSSFGPVSWAFCSECANMPAEPLCMFAYLYDDVSDRGDGLSGEVNQFFTFIDGAYVSWRDYVRHRREAAPT